MWLVSEVQIIQPFYNGYIIKVNDTTYCNCTDVGSIYFSYNVVIACDI